ncbi:hypothetical protein QTG54_005545 [Skeletonema marinoi]|uniref:Uncharacterized protein n=1 Tax=Skeletonema marinoi TaxID=267567 RepID=A0AAD8YCZ2_9STRA|nr:hypothetical protein QTG54_005545 [Skeletonema marinoi]
MDLCPPLKVNETGDPAADADLAEGHVNADEAKISAAAGAGGGSEAASTTRSAASQQTTVETKCIVEGVLNILDLRDETKLWLEQKYTEQKSFEDFLHLSSKKVKDMQLLSEEIDSDKKEEKVRARFNQADRAKLILLRRWTENNRADGQKFKWQCFNRESFDAFVREEVPNDILLEILQELKLSEEVKESLKDNGVHTPASFVEKSKYWYEHEIELSSTDVNEIEKFKKWYKYQLDTYLPSDWIVAFREEAAHVNDLEWRKVLKAIGLKADAIHALEINDICDFVALIYTSEKWRIAEPTSKKNRYDVSNTDWDGWKSLGLNMSDARHIINFRHWHNFYVAGKKDKSDWATEFSSAHYERFVQRYTNPTKPDKFNNPGWWASKNDHLKLSKEKQDYVDILHQAVEAGSVTEEQRYQLRQHYKGRREKMELIQEINEGAGDSSFQEKRLGEIFEEEAANDHEKNTQDLLFFQNAVVIQELGEDLKETSLYIYILTWILLGVISLLFGAIAGVDTSNPLYTTGQTWLGIAVTIGYSYFGLNNRTNEASKDENDEMDDAGQGAPDGGDDDANGRNGGEVAKFTNERVEMLPTADDLKSQLAEAEEKMRAAIDVEVKLHKVVIALKRKLKEEHDVAADGDTSSILL